MKISKNDKVSHFWTMGQGHVIAISTKSKGVVKKSDNTFELIEGYLLYNQSILYVILTLKYRRKKPAIFRSAPNKIRF